MCGNVTELTESVLEIYTFWWQVRSLRDKKVWLLFAVFIILYLILIFKKKKFDKLSLMAP